MSTYKFHELFKGDTRIYIDYKSYLNCFGMNAVSIDISTAQVCTVGCDFTKAPLHLGI